MARRSVTEGTVTGYVTICHAVNGSDVGCPTHGVVDAVNWSDFVHDSAPDINSARCLLIFVAVPNFLLHKKRFNVNQRRPCSVIHWCLIAVGNG